MSPNVGLEPTTPRLSVSCSTDGASRDNYKKSIHFCVVICSYIYLRFKHAVLDTYFSNMDRLSRKVSFSVLGGKVKVVTLLEVSDKEQGVVALTYDWPFKTCSGLKPEQRYEPSTYQPISR